jgi:predicted transcriptional regulator
MDWLDSYNKRKTELGWIVRKNKVLECLNGRELGYNQIMQETKLKYPSVAYMLNDLELAKIIKSRSVAGNKLYSVNDQLPSDAML